MEQSSQLALVYLRQGKLLHCRGGCHIVQEQCKLSIHASSLIFTLTGSTQPLRKRNSIFVPNQFVASFLRPPSEANNGSYTEIIDQIVTESLPTWAEFVAVRVRLHPKHCSGSYSTHARAIPQCHSLSSYRFLLGDSFLLSHFFSWWYILAALSYSRFRFP